MISSGLMDLREVEPVNGASLFQIDPIEITKEKSFTLPDFSHLLGEEKFYDLSFIFGIEGLKISLSVEKSFTGCFLPEYEKGDAFLLMLDTRGISGAKSLHKYCHQLLFFPKEVEGLKATEITMLRIGDKRELVDTSKITVNTKLKKIGYDMEILIPDRSFYGYDLESFPKMRLACIVYGGKENTGHFPISEIDFKLRSYPALWAPIVVK